MAERMRHIFFHEDFPAPALRSQREKFWIGAVHRDAEPQRQFFLPARRVKGNKMCAIGIHYQRADALDQPWPLEQFVAQRTH